MIAIPANVRTIVVMTRAIAPPAFQFSGNIWTTVMFDSTPQWRLAAFVQAMPIVKIATNRVDRAQVVTCAPIFTSRSRKLVSEPLASAGSTVHVAGSQGTTF